MSQKAVNLRDYVSQQRQHYVLISFLILHIYKGKMDLIKFTKC